MRCSSKSALKPVFVTDSMDMQASDANINHHESSDSVLENETIFSLINDAFSYKKKQ